MNARFTVRDLAQAVVYVDEHDERPEWLGDVAPALARELLVLLDRVGESAAEIRRRKEEAQLGPMPHVCLNLDCGVIEYGPGYLRCPRCGDMSGRDRNPAPAGARRPKARAPRRRRDRGVSS